MISSTEQQSKTTTLCPSTHAHLHDPAHQLLTKYTAATPLHRLPAAPGTPTLNYTTIVTTMDGTLATPAQTVASCSTTTSTIAPICRPNHLMIPHLGATTKSNQLPLTVANVLSSNLGGGTAIDYLHLGHHRPTSLLHHLRGCPNKKHRN